MTAEPTAEPTTPVSAQAACEYWVYDLYDRSWEQGPFETMAAAEWVAGDNNSSAELLGDFGTDFEYFAQQGRRGRRGTRGEAMNDDGTTRGDPEDYAVVGGVRCRIERIRRTVCGMGYEARFVPDDSGADAVAADCAPCASGDVPHRLTHEDETLGGDLATFVADEEQARPGLAAARRRARERSEKSADDATNRPEEHLQAHVGAPGGRDAAPRSSIRRGEGYVTPYFATDRGSDVALWHGDALEGLRGYGDDAFDLVVTSPPYNMGLVPGGNGGGMYRPGANNKGGKFRAGYGAHADALPQDEYDAWQRQCLVEMHRVARLGVFYNHRPRVEHGILRDPLSGDYGGLTLRHRIVWDRGTGIDVNLRSFCTRGEYVLVFPKPDFALVDHSASGMGDVWRIPPESVAGHPAPFPVELPRRCIAATGARSVLDPFCGSGSTLVAAQRLGVDAEGIDNHEPYLALAAERLGGPIRHDDGSLFAPAARRPSTEGTPK